jgi:2'-5' RNA ligase
MRVFVAINLGDGERARLAGAAQRLRESDFPVRWVPPQNVHLTLKFLGEVGEDRLAGLFSAVDAASSGIAAFDMTLRGFGAFPALRRPRVVWAGVEHEATLARLQENVELALEAVGYERENRRFSPHLTLGRARKRARAGDFEGFEGLVNRLTYEGTFRVPAVDVMRSRLEPGGAIYSVLHSTSLVT